MTHKAWHSIEEVPYCFSRSSVHFQCHAGQKIANFYPNWVLPDCNSSLNIPMSLKCCTKLNVVWKRCSIVFQGRPIKFQGQHPRSFTASFSLVHQHLCILLTQNMLIKISRVVQDVLIKAFIYGAFQTRVGGRNNAWFLIYSKYKHRIWGSLIITLYDAIALHVFWISIRNMHSS